MRFESSLKRIAKTNCIPLSVFCLLISILCSLSPAVSANICIIDTVTVSSVRGHAKYCMYENDSGRTASQVDVVLLKRDGEGNPKSLVQAKTDADGVFNLIDIRPGRYLLQFKSPAGLHSFDLRVVRKNLFRWYPPDWLEIGLGLYPPSGCPPSFIKASRHTREPQASVLSSPLRSDEIIVEGTVIGVEQPEFPWPMEYQSLKFFYLRVTKPVRGQKPAKYLRIGYGYNPRANSSTNLSEEMFDGKSVWRFRLSKWKDFSGSVEISRREDDWIDENSATQNAKGEWSIPIRPKCIPTEGNQKEAEALEKLGKLNGYWLSWNQANRITE